MSASPKQTAPGEATELPCDQHAPGECDRRLCPKCGGYKYVGVACTVCSMRGRIAKNSAAVAAYASLRAALTEAVDTTFDEAATWLSEANYGPLPPPADMREHAASLRAKAEAWRKVLTDSEVGT